MTSHMLHLLVFISLTNTIKSQSIVCDQGTCPSSINCATSNCHVTCNEYGCNGKTINCQSNQCDISCAGSHGCYNAIINCPVNAGCNIQCTGANSCQLITINGQNGSQSRLIAGCKGFSSCKDAIFNGRDAKELTITDCTQTDACIGMTIYCPQYEFISSPRCSISGDADGFGGTIADPMTFYAVNGWDDVNMIATTDKRVGRMYCKTNYDTMCVISQNFSNLNTPWTCQSGMDCDELTPNPTIHQPTTPQPTTSNPTTPNPTTHQPTAFQLTTQNPTNSPTTTAPTIAPITRAPTTLTPTTVMPVITNSTSYLSKGSNTTITTTSMPTSNESLGISIVISFKYELENNISNISIISGTSINNILTDIIHLEIKNASICAQNSSYDIKIMNENHNEMVINAMILICNQNDGNHLISSLNQSLYKEFITKMSKELNIINFDVTLEVSVISSKEGEVITTAHTTIANENNYDKSNDDMTVIYIVVPLITCILIFICFCFIKRCKKKNDMECADIQMIHIDTTPTTQQKTVHDKDEETSIEEMYGKIESHRIVKQEDNDSEDEQMYINNITQTKTDDGKTNGDIKEHQILTTANNAENTKGEQGDDV